MKTLLWMGCVLLLSSSLWGQTTERPNALSLKFLWQDYLFLDANTPDQRFFYPPNMTWGVDLGYSRQLNSSLNLHVPIRLGIIDAYHPDTLLDASGNITYLDSESRLYPSEFFAGLDATLRYKFSNGYILSETAAFQPYVFAGIGGMFMSERESPIDVQIPVGIGTDIRINEAFAVQLQYEYRQSLLVQKNNLVLTAGFNWAFGKQKEKPEPEPSDRDNDGIPDEKDECPDEPGLAVFAGCPDSDGDGIKDKEDDCPMAAGPMETGGCPDSDNDGLIDKEDDCPNEPGPISNQGCPEVEEVQPNDLDILKQAMRDVRFETGKAKLLESSNAVLDKVAEVMQRYPDYNLRIHGYTDNVGSRSANLVLSKERAKACYDYLLSKGVAAERLSHDGFGESNFIGDNDTTEGRAENRRVEFKIYKAE